MPVPLVQFHHLARTIALRPAWHNVLRLQPGPRIPALRDVSGALQPGEIVWLRGPNGAGKSTLLMVLAQLMKPDRGEIQQIQAPIAWLGSDRLGLTPRATVEKHLKWQQNPQKPEQTLEFFGLQPLLHRRTRELSRGEQVRLALASAVLADCHVWLLDETLAALDDAILLQFLEFLRERRDMVLLVSHDARVAPHVDRQLELADGLLESADVAPPPVKMPTMPQTWQLHRLTLNLLNDLAQGPMAHLRRLLVVILALLVPWQLADGQPERAAGLWCGLLALGLQTGPVATGEQRFFAGVHAGVDDVLRARGLQPRAYVALSLLPALGTSLLWSLPLLLALLTVQLPTLQGLLPLLSGLLAIVGLLLASWSLSILVRNAMPLMWLVHALTLAAGPVAVAKTPWPPLVQLVGEHMPAALLATGLRLSFHLPAVMPHLPVLAALLWLGLGLLLGRVALNRYTRDGSLGLRT